jgi:hypothetical protein
MVEDEHRAAFLHNDDTNPVAPTKGARLGLKRYAGEDAYLEVGSMRTISTGTLKEHRGDGCVGKQETRR